MKKELTQYQVIELAKAKHADNPLVSALLATLLEARCAVEQHQPMLASYSTAMLELLRDPSQPGRSIPHANTDLVTSAAKMASALDLYARTVMNLACVLQGLGEDIVY